MIIHPLDADTPAAHHLIALSDEYMSTLYPAESNHLESVSALKQANVYIIGGYVNNELVACGAVKLLVDDGVYGEIKRVFVMDTHRGKGYSKLLMQRLEQYLREQKISIARLETGILQPEAIQLYRKLGYVERKPFGAYTPDPLSVFMEKSIIAS